MINKLGDYWQWHLVILILSYNLYLSFNNAYAVFTSLIVEWFTCVLFQHFHYSHFWTWILKWWISYILWKKPYYISEHSFLAYFGMLISVLVYTQRTEQHTIIVMPVSVRRADRTAYHSCNAHQRVRVYGEGKTTDCNSNLQKWPAVKVWITFEYFSGNIRHVTWLYEVRSYQPPRLFQAPKLAAVTRRSYY